MSITLFPHVVVACLAGALLAIAAGAFTCARGAREGPPSHRRSRPHVARPKHVRCGRAHCRLQPAVSAHVQIVAGRGEAGLHAARIDRASSADRVVHRRSRAVLQGNHGRRRRRQHLEVDRERQRRPHRSRDQCADAGRRLGIDARRHHRATKAAATARRHGQAGRSVAARSMP